MNAAMARPEALLLLFVLIFAPLAFGTVEPWSLAIAESAALAALALALCRRTRDGRLRLLAVPGILPLLLFLLLLVLQCLPLPSGLLLWLSPAAHQRWDAALGGSGPLPWLPLSLDPLATLREFLRFSSCAAVYILAVQLLARRERLRAVASTLAIFVAALSFAAILQYLIAPQRLLFVRDSPSLQSFGPFVNRNHYADLMAMLMPVVFGLFLGRGRGAGASTLRGRLADLLGRREASVRLLLGFSALLGAASLLISLSRGATVAVSAALLVFGVCLLIRGIGSRRAIAAALFFFALTVFVGWFGWDKIAERFTGLRANPDIVDEVRAALWRDTLRQAGDFPVLGAGVGSFERLYPAYRTVPGPKAIAHAHNDHLELLAGGGAVGLGLYGWFAASVLLAVARACRRRRESAALYLAFGAFAGCVAFLVHGASDFSLAIGANALNFFFLLGLAVSASHTLGERDDPGTLLDAWRLPRLVSHAAAALALLAVLIHAADLTARSAWSLALEEARRSEALQVLPARAGRLLGLASRLQPLESAYPAALARLALREGKTEEALRLTRHAVRLLPIDAGTLAQLGSLLGARGEDAAARRSFAAAVASEPSVSRNHEAFGAWLLSRGDRAAAATQLRLALTLAPERTTAIVSLLVLGGLDDEQIAEVLPPGTAVLLVFARYLETTGNQRLAGETYRRVLRLEPGNGPAADGLRGLGLPQ